MIDKGADDRDETEAVWASMIEMEATLRPVSGAYGEPPSADVDQIEPCAIAPIIKMEAQLKPVKKLPPS